MTLMEKVKEVMNDKKQLLFRRTYIVIIIII